MSMGNLYSQDYELPESREVILDKSKNEVIEKEDIGPLEVIRATAYAAGITINDPKPSCNKCYGRGYSGTDFNTKMPIPCKCIYPAKSQTEKQAEYEFDSSRLGGRPNRDQRRNMRKQFRKMIKRNPAQFIKSMAMPEGQVEKPYSEESSDE